MVSGAYVVRHRLVAGLHAKSWCQESRGGVGDSFWEPWALREYTSSRLQTKGLLKPLGDETLWGATATREPVGTPVLGGAQVQERNDETPVRGG